MLESGLKQIDNESNESDYEIKDHCAWCGAEIEIDWARFQTRGNSCEFCQSRHRRVADKKITREQSKRELIERIEKLNLRLI